MLPSAIHLAANGYKVTVGCQADDNLAKEIPSNIGYLPLSISRGYSIGATLKTIVQLYRFFKKERIQMVNMGRKMYHYVQP